MLQKILTIIIIFLIAILAVGGAWFYFFVRSNQAPTEVPVTEVPAPPLPISPTTPSPAPTTGNSNLGSNSAPPPATPPAPSLPLETVGTAARFRQLSIGPVAGAYVKPGAGASTSPTLYYIEAATGHLFSPDYSSTGSAPLAEPKQVANTTVRNVASVVWGQDKNNLKFVLTNEKDGQLRHFSINNSLLASSTPLAGIFLPDAILALAVNPTGDKIFTLEKKGWQVEGWLGGFRGESKVKKWQSDFSSWRVSWPEANTIIFFPQPSALAEGALYALDLKSGNFSRLITRQTGFAALMAPDAKKFIYAKSAGKLFTSLIYSRAAATGTELPFHTWPEKCVWPEADQVICAVPVATSVPPGRYPDNWYQGKVHFNDEVWLYRADTGEARQLLPTANQAFDMTQLNLSPNGNQLYFIDKNTQLWWEVTLPL